MVLRFTVWILLLVSTTFQAQWFDWSTPTVPRTADGTPDLTAPIPRTLEGLVDMSGVWTPEDARGSLFDTSKIQGWALDAMLVHEKEKEKQLLIRKSKLGDKSFG